MGFMVNKSTYEIQTCPSEQVMIENGWSKDEWTFEESLDSLIDTDEYTVRVEAMQKEAKTRELQLQIDELDLKSVRAIREGGVKDEATGQSWIEYYTQRIQDLRAQIAQL